MGVIIENTAKWNSITVGVISLNVVGQNIKQS